ncbi:uncharacterized protein LOC125829028 [Solanum verrucosum]|uniref:uncharacterized protein LOC125829028 n=1 Tax=Solanum verrucosum TaxID=315347 RepID=UPI0020D1CD0E|nr:uncharacterized protein LOC125829028 [Solanum verrucosum]
MTTRWANARRLGEGNIEQEVPPQAPIDPLNENVTNGEFRSAFQVFSQAVMTQANREEVSPVNPSVGTTVARIRDFTKMNPPKFYGSKLEEDPQVFIDEVYKVLSIMDVTLVEKAEQVKECRTTMLVHDMYISRLMVHSQQIEEEKLKESSREAKSAKVDDGNFEHSRFGGRGRSRLRQRYSGKISTNAPPRP